MAAQLGLPPGSVHFGIFTVGVGVVFDGEGACNAAVRQVEYLEAARGQ